MKKILIIGGTGSMGKALVDLIDKSKMDVYVTSRKKYESKSIHYIQGNAHDLPFLDYILNLEEWDSIIDFMNYKTYEFETIAPKILSKTKQYIFLSSARVYAPSEAKLSEDSPRLLDVCEDEDYIATNEYAISKAKEENFLLNSELKNWTIVRPSLTYNDNRMQFALWEKEEWLYRAMQGRSIIFPKSMMNIKTTMSYGVDVSSAIEKLICNERTYGEIIQIAGAKAMTWEEILEVYSKVIKEITNKEVKVCYLDDWQEISKKCHSYYKAKYARALNREFTCQKLYDFVGEISFTSPEEGLTKCVESFLENGAKFNTISWRTEAICNRISGERTSLNEFKGVKRKICYLIFRYFPLFMLYK